MSCEVTADADAQKILANLRAECQTLRDQIEEAVKNGHLDSLHELRHRLFTLEEREIPTAEIKVAENSFALCEEKTAEAKRQAAEARTEYDRVFWARDQRVKDLQIELADLKLDRDGAVARAHHVLLTRGQEVESCREEENKQRQHLADLRAKQQAKTQS